MADFEKEHVKGDIWIIKRYDSWYPVRKTPQGNFAFLHGSGRGSVDGSKADALRFAQAKTNPSLPKGKVYKCGKCGKTFKTKTGINKHLDHVARVGHPASVKGYGNERSMINPSVPKNKFISCKAVKFNRNGSVSIKK